MTGTQYHGVDNLEVLDDAVRYNRFLVDCVIRGCGGAASAVDFGAGTGSLSVQVRERGLRITCIELDPTLRGRLAALGFQVHADLGELPDASLDFVYSLNVLEHIEDDGRALQSIRAKLKPGGRCFVYVPAFQVLYSSMDRKIGHFRRYRRRGLTALARGCDFEVERAEYADSMGFFVTLLYRLIGSRRGDVSRTTVKVYDRFVFPLSRFFDRLGCRLFFGKNLMVVLKRPADGRA